MKKRKDNKLIEKFALVLLSKDSYTDLTRREVRIKMVADNKQDLYDSLEKDRRTIIGKATYTILPIIEVSEVHEVVEDNEK